jgi:aspartyl-tRNA(Asn)/glutamyl-tRNA(Gln) amidotransferase subunit A
MGTDTGGSIRLPASFTGVVGFKPTYGSVSRYGVIAMASSLDSIGHFTHTVEDAEKIFNVTAGVDNLDGTLKKQKFKVPEKLTIGLPREYFDEGIDSEVKASVLNAVEELKKQGIKFVDVSLPNTKYAVATYYIIQPAEVSSNLGRFDGIRFGFDRTRFGSEAKRRIMLGSYVLSSGYYDAFYSKAQKVRTLIIQEFENVFTSVDALLMPTSPTPPFKLGEKVSDPLQMYLTDALTVSANLAGLPGISIPSGFTKSGLPLSFQILGERFHEDTLFEIGKIYQNSTNWHLKTPNL